MDFFEDLGKKISKTYNVASEKTGKIAKEAKLKMDISDAQSKIENEYKNVGKKIYEKYLNHRDDELAKEFINEFKSIDKYNEVIAKNQEEILNLKDKKKCINCGSEFDAKYEFCPKCGAKNDVKIYDVKKDNE